MRHARLSRDPWLNDTPQTADTGASGVQAAAAAYAMPAPDGSIGGGQPAATVAELRRVDSAGVAWRASAPPWSGSSDGGPGIYRALGEHLRELAELSELQIDRVLSYQREHGLRFGEAALRLQFVSREQLQRALSSQFDGPVLGPDAKGLAPQLVMVHQPFGPAAERYRSLRAQLLAAAVQRPMGPTRTALAVLSADRGDGRSAVAANLALAFAQMGLRTLLIDADLRHPCQQAWFGGHGRLGLGNLLSGSPDAEPQAVVAVPGLWLMAAGSPPPNPVELLQRPAFEQQLQVWSARFDQVVVDAPAASHGADATVLAARCGEALLVGRPGHTSLGRLQDLVQALQRQGTRVHGLVFRDA